MDRHQFVSHSCVLCCVMVVVGVLMLGCPAPASPAESISVAISAPQGSYRASQPLTMIFTLKNVSSTMLSVLKWNTPLDGFHSDMFRVEINGRPVQYTGMLVYRQAPSADDFIQLQPNQQVSIEFDLAGQYAVYAAGEYSIRYDSIISSASARSPQTLALTPQVQGLPHRTIASNTVRIAVLEVRPTPPERVVLPRYVNCTETEKNVIFGVLPDAETISLAAYSALDTLASTERSHAERYQTWFRTYSSSNYSTVVGNLKSISNAIGHEQLAFTCNPAACRPTWVAYVYGNDPYRVYLCPQYWSFRTAGRDSQAGILVHEVSHFDSTADTGDSAYCWYQQDCTALTASQAIANADSYRRFCENDPPLQPTGPIQTSIFCPDGERCCQFDAAGVCTRCEATTLQCDQGPTCDATYDKVERCTGTIAGKTFTGFREVRCVNGRLVRGPCYPQIP